MSLRIEKLHEAIGAEVTGIDLAKPLGRGEVAEIERAWLDHIVLVFRGQDLDQEAQLRFAGRFGIVGERSRPAEIRPEGADSHPAIMLVSNIRENGKPIGSLPDGEMWFHHDMCYVAEPYRGTMLYAIDIPSHGGNTLFANMYAAYERLGPATKERIAGARALQIYNYSVTEKGSARRRSRRLSALCAAGSDHPSQDRPQGALCQPADHRPYRRVARGRERQPCWKRCSDSPRITG